MMQKILIFQQSAWFSVLRNYFNNSKYKIIQNTRSFSDLYLNFVAKFLDTSAKAFSVQNYIKGHFFNDSFLTLAIFAIDENQR